MNNQQLHDEAMALFDKMKPYSAYKHATKVVWNYNEIRKHATAKLKPILAEMQMQFDKAENIGGCTSMKEYCKRFRNQGCLTYARCRQIITGTSGNEGKVKSVRSLDLKPGMIVSFPVYVGDGNETKVMKFRVDSLPVGDGDFHSPRAKDLKGKRFANIILEVVEEPTLTLGLNTAEVAVSAMADALLKKRLREAKKELKECERIGGDQSNRLECAKENVPGYVAPTSDEIEAHAGRVNKVVEELRVVQAEMVSRNLLTPRKSKGAAAD